MRVLTSWGLTLGLTLRGRLGSYEVNWKPGPPPSLYLELDVVRNSIQYAAFLAEQRSNR